MIPGSATCLDITEVTSAQFLSYLQRTRSPEEDKTTLEHDAKAGSFYDPRLEKSGYYSSRPGEHVLQNSSCKTFGPGLNELPVVCVDQKHADDFCRWSRKRLPSFEWKRSPKSAAFRSRITRPRSMGGRRRSVSDEALRRG